MPRNPDLPCAGCGKAMWKGSTSRPVGEAMCQPCRRERAASRRGQCGWCGCGFTPKRARGGWTATCSHRCAALLRLRDRDKQRPSWSRETRELMQGLTKGQRRDLLHKWQRQGRTCVYCPAPATTVEHVVPLVRGGLNYEGNLAPCCARCNNQKRDRTVMEWRLGKQAGPSALDLYSPNHFLRRRAERPARQIRVVEQMAMRSCPMCGSLTDRPKYCGIECQLEGNARSGRDRHRARVGLHVDPSEPTSMFGKRLAGVAA